MPDAADRSPDDDAFLDELERRTFAWFLDHTDPATGRTPDRTPDPAFASIAAIGFGLTGYGIGAERGWITRAEAVARTAATLDALLALPQHAGPDAGGHRGFFYHFLDLRTGLRYGGCELSSVDTALLMGGVLFAAAYFDADDPAERAVREAAKTLYARVDWTFLQSEPPLVSMGWTPEHGHLSAQWRGYNEAMLVVLLALGSPTHPVGEDAWPAWCATYDRAWGRYGGEQHLAFGPLFGHQYSHLWVDFAGIADPWCRAHGLDYAENSRRAAVAQQRHAIDNPGGWDGYGADFWGLTACDGPGGAPGVPAAVHGVPLRDYSARGAGLTDAFDDGTVAPTGAAGMVAFAPGIVVPTLRAMAGRPGLYGPYGFADAANPTVGWTAGTQLGIDQGPILGMTENHRSGLVWRTMRSSPHLRRGLERAGFTGGWLAAPAPS